MHLREAQLGGPASRETPQWISSPSLGVSKGGNRGMEHNSRFKKLLGGIAAAVALTFVAAPAATAAPPDDTTNVSSKPTAKRDTGWG